MKLLRLAQRSARYPAVLAASALCAVLCSAGLVWAIDDAVLMVDSVAGEGWTAEGLAIRVSLRERPTASVSIDRFRLGAVAQEVRGLRVDCGAVQISDQRIECRGMRVAARLSGLALASTRGSAVYGRRDGSLSLSLPGLQLAQGALDLRLSLRRQAWSVDAALRRVPLEPLLKLARDVGAPLPQLSATGEVSLTARANGRQAAVQRFEIQAQVANLTASNAQGSLATDKLSFDATVAAQRYRAGASSGWKFTTELRASSGQAYAQPIFADLTVNPVQLAASGEWQERALRLQHFEIDHSKVVRARGTVLVDFAQETALRDLQLDLQQLQFPGAYATYFQPFLLDSNFKALQTSGAMQGRVDMSDATPQRIDLKFEGVSFEDAERNFALGGLNGEWHWVNQSARGEDDDETLQVASAALSSLSWRDGALLGLDLGASELKFTTAGRQFRLLEPTRIPVLDGALELESFRVRNAGLPTVAFIVDASIRPISVTLLCRAFGWPEFGGAISGVISKLRMREGTVTLGTTLQAQVFDGAVSISDLKLEDPFGQWPRFNASVGLQNLDLELLTGAFSFGKITGRLSGDIRGLRLFNWTPVAFDARLYTPPADRSRHRISQRAVQNIGSLGGGAGVTAALSSGFMRFFDNFNYDRLGIACRLENEVCQMSGIAPAPNGGYYLVKGKGIPRIDVIGNSSRVDWPRLVKQLVAVTRSEGPVVQ